MLVPCDVFSNMIFSNAIFPNTIFSNPTFWNMICRKLTLTSLTCKRRGEAAASETSRSLAAPGWRGLLPVASVLFGMAIVGGLVLSPGEGSAQVSLGTPITLETSMADDPPCNGNDCPSTTRTGNQAGTIPAPGEAIPNAGAGAPAVPERALPEHALPGYVPPDRPFAQSGPLDQGGRNAECKFAARADRISGVRRQFCRPHPADLWL